MMWLLLAGAILTEVTATLFLRVASTGSAAGTYRSASAISWRLPSSP